MNTRLLQLVLGAALWLAALLPLLAAEEQDLIATLQSSASPSETWTACQKLRLIGTAQSVPALSALLADERAAHAARHVLEALPHAEAGAALRGALGRTSGLIKAGIIDSLGWRRESAAVPQLASLLSDENATIAAAAATALGRIGGREAIEALTAELEDGQTDVRSHVQDALLECAETLAGNNDQTGAASVYRRLITSRLPAQVRMGAWRGLALQVPGERPNLFLQALAGTDAVPQAAALKLLREINDPGLVRLCASRWSDLRPEAHLAVLDAQVSLGPEALPTARLASQSSDTSLRTAAWLALGTLSDLQSVPALVKAAASGEPSEREAARESLSRLRGPDARQALLTHLKTAPETEQPELLRTFGNRGDRAAVPVLLEHAASRATDVRVAALDAIRMLAPAAAVAPLLEIAAKSSSEEERDPVLKALYAVCEASPDKAQAARSVVSAMERFPAAERRQILPLLAELATPEALRAAEAAAQSPDKDLAREAVRVLGQWPDAGPAEALLALAGSAQDSVLQTLALRSAVQVSSQEPRPSQRLALLERGLAVARSADEKKQVLGQLAQLATPEAMDVAVRLVTDSELVNEAALAAVSIAEKLAPKQPKLADATASKVLAQVKEGEVARRAWALRLKPSSAESFLRNWVVSGPYQESEARRTADVFKVEFPPEKSTETVKWRIVPSTDTVDLAALFPEAVSCAAYLRTVIIAPEDRQGALLMGSDDGIKAWLNGDVVHSNNVDRPQLVDEDTAPIRLKKGRNELILKITQGGGGWSACARVVGVDGKPISGLVADRPALGDP